jgi:hypothetical protein
MFLAASHGHLLAQDRYILDRLGGEIEFDGVGDEPAWDSIKPLPIIMFNPVYGIEPSEETKIRIAYDDSYLYMNAICHDSQADKMKIQFRRDDWNYGVDWVGLILDTFNDRENTLTFNTSPSGGRTDVAFSNDAANLALDMNLSWNTFWDVRSKADDTGWQVEMRIPFSSLRFKDSDGDVVMGLSAWRYISNTSELYVFPQVDIKHGFWGTFKASQTHEILIQGIESKKPLYLTPYILGGLSQDFALNDEKTEYVRSDKFARGLGLDMKYRVSDNLTLDVTVNTDFAQVEADDQVVNLTRFSLFFPEKRQFFQERRSNFEFNFDQQNRLFYTRRIGIYDGKPVGIYGGARLVGRAGGWDVGVLSMQSAPVEDLSSENFTVMRLRRQVINPSTYIGGILTNRMDFKGGSNTAYGLDGVFRLFGDDYLKVMWAQTFENENENNPLSLDPARIYLNWERRSLEGLAYNLVYSRAGEDYNPGIGYEQRSNYSKYSAGFLYGWIRENSWIRNHKIMLDGFYYSNNVDNSTQSAEIWLGWDFLSNEGAIGEITGRMIYDNLLEDFNLSEEDSVLAGAYTFFNVKGLFRTSRGKSFTFGTDFEIGPYYDGWLSSISISPKWIIKNMVQFDATYQFNSANFSERDQQFVAHIFRLNGLLTLSTKFSIAAFVQYNSAVDAVISNFRLRYNPREGNDFYIVYNEGYHTDRYRELPVFPITSERTILVKYTYTFIL